MVVKVFACSELHPYCALHHKKVTLSLVTPTPHYSSLSQLLQYFLLLCNRKSKQHCQETFSIDRPEENILQQTEIKTDHIYKTTIS